MRHKILGLPVILSLLFLALPVQAYEEGQWVYRVGVATVQPDDKNLVVDDSFPLGAMTVEVEGATSATFNLTYFFTPHFAFDVLAALPFDHDIVAVVDGTSFKVAETNHLPPTISLQYHLLPEGNFKPYVGVGANWTTFFNTDVIEGLSDAGVSLELDDSFGFAAQVGADFLIGEDWLINADVRYIEIETDATFKNLPTQSGPVDVTAAVPIDPIVFSVSFGYRF